MFYFVKTPGWLQKLYKRCTWQIAGADKVLYITFDDGPHPVITPIVLDELKKYGARATFFCVGKNVLDYPQVYTRILDEGHAVGNHSFSHLNGWKTANGEYLADIAKAKKNIDSDLFRPPYGKATRFQQKVLSGKGFHLKIVMWTVLSGDFDPSITPVQCCRNVTRNAGNGSIVVFHDSEKANARMCYALPLVLKYFSDKGYRFEKIPGLIR